MKRAFLLLGVLVVFAGCGVGKETSGPSSSPTPPAPEVLADTVVANELRREASAKTPSVRPAKEPPSSPATENPCTGADAGNFDCYEAWFAKLVKEQGIPQAFTILKEAYPVNKYVRSQCHPITHVIGNVASEKFASVSEAYTQGDSFCWSGYYHGIMEGVLGKIGRSNLPNHMNGICTDLATKRRYSFDHYNCVHGLGHGVMATNGNELFDSLKICDALSDAWDRSSCWSGAFMENIIIDNKNHFTKYLKADDLLYPCTAVEEQYKHPCYLMQTSYILKVVNGDFARTFQECTRSDENFKAICYQSIGRDASGRSVSNVGETRQSCLLGVDFDQQSNCVIGAVKDFISYHHGDTEALEFCASLPTPELQEVCTSTAKSYVTVL